VACEGPPWSLREIQENIREQAFEAVPDDCVLALVEAANALDALYEAEWMVRDGGGWARSAAERRAVTDRAARALGRFKDREMDEERE